MRTTIEIPEGQRDRLLKLAAERGQKGCGKVVQEAVARYLDQQERGPAPAPLVGPSLATLPESRPETRADRLWTVAGWIYEEVAGLVVMARSLTDRLWRPQGRAGVN